MTDRVDIAAVDQIVREQGRGPEAVIPVLQAIQEQYRYLPDEALKRVCELSEITPAAIEGVSTFFSQFRRSPVGKHVISVCDGTACHVKRSLDIHDSVAQELGLTADADTDADGLFTLRKVACLGCCTLAPAVQIDAVTFGHVRPEAVGEMLREFLALEEHRMETGGFGRGRGSDKGHEIRIGLDSCCVAGGTARVKRALDAALAEIRADVMVKHVSCVHMCHQVPVLEILSPGQEAALYAKVEPEDVSAIIARHFRAPDPVTRLRFKALHWLEGLYAGEAAGANGRRAITTHDRPVEAFLGGQHHLATERRGEIDPADLDEYVRAGGFDALKRCLPGADGGLDADRIIEEITLSGLRGRGGAGFPTGRKWATVRAAPAKKKYIICNGDEGDPGAFMDRMILESYAYRVLEGMAIAALAVGATEGLLYIRAEYPLAVRRVRQAIEDCLAAGLLGNDILGSGASLKLRVVQGAGAFVCGEETAMIAALEGKRGHPSLRPPYPAERGLFGCPTLINNTETYALVPWIVKHGHESFAALGTASSKGTKVFSLAGKIRRGGLIEVPMGISLRRIVEEIGGGVPDGRTFKAVQVGGPSGGCIPASLCDTPVDYESLTEIGAMMGSGGLIVLDDTDCMVELARYFLAFTQQESCGHCAPCRVGTTRMLELLTLLCDGKANKNDIRQIEELAALISSQSLCGLGKTAPNPVMTTLKYFRDEFEAHVEGRCPAGRCKKLITYSVTDQCIGCTKCAQICPTDAIEFRPYALHEIDPVLCTRCDACRPICPTDAIMVGSEP